MPYRINGFNRGQYYHIYNRGASRGPLFFNPGNYEYCVRLVERYYGRYGACIIAYCLMPNHYHFLLRQETDQPLSRFINLMFNAYVQALNRQQARNGTLFEGRFHSIWVDREEYLIQLCRYIHLNPVKAKLSARPEDWRYSNYLEWIGRRSGPLRDDIFIRSYFSTPIEYSKFVMEFEGELSVDESIKKYTWDWEEPPVQTHSANVDVG